MSDETTVIASDGLSARRIKPHAREKFDRHGKYCGIFNRGMGSKAEPTRLPRAIRRATADDVNQAFAGMMIGHHTGAIRMAELAKEKVGHEELKTLAGDIIAAQQREIDIIEAYFMGAHG
jgi:uncharacterized protein (DUF305 family)